MAIFLVGQMFARWEHGATGNVFLTYRTLFRSRAMGAGTLVIAEGNGTIIRSSRRNRSYLFFSRSFPQRAEPLVNYLQCGVSAGGHEAVTMVSPPAAMQAIQRFSLLVKIWLADKMMLITYPDILDRDPYCGEYENKILSTVKLNIRRELKEIRRANPVPLADANGPAPAGDPAPAAPGPQPVVDGNR